MSAWFWHKNWVWQRVKHLEILWVDIKRSSIRRCWSTMWMHILILLLRPHAFCEDHSHLPSDLVMWSKMPSLVGQKNLYVSFHPSVHELSALRYQLGSPCDIWVMIVKTSQVVSCLTNLRTFIVPLSLNPTMNSSIGSIALLVHLGPSCGMPSCRSSSMMSHFSMDPSPSLPCMTSLILKHCRHHEKAFSWLPCKLCLTPCAGNSTIGSLWLVDKLPKLQPCLELCRFAQALLKPRHAEQKVPFPHRVAREPNYNILSERMTYYSRYATG
jgi:hypothetical protein